ncbi:Uncharacterised protein [Mycobacteroides abscessus subsp. abscessus]|nr:Uncharacterised protein [Mycobacteroides abscessus subsp. abscessus]
MKSTISTGVYTIPSLSAVRLKAEEKNLSYSSRMIRWRPSALSIPSTRERTEA